MGDVPGPCPGTVHSWHLLMDAATRAVFPMGAGRRAGQDAELVGKSAGVARVDGRLSVGMNWSLERTTLWAID